jgi:hypothetical protein
LTLMFSIVVIVVITRTIRYIKPSNWNDGRRRGFSGHTMVGGVRRGDVWTGRRVG